MGRLVGGMDHRRYDGIGWRIGMAGKLEKLAAVAGLVPSYRDAWGHERIVSESTQRAILSAMGYEVDTPPQIEASMRRIEEARWRRTLEPVVVTRRGKGGHVHIPVTFDDAVGDLEIAWRLEMENGAARDGSVRPRELSVQESRELGDEKLRRRHLHFGFPVPYGYHSFRLFPTEGDHVMQDGESCLVIVVPEKCYLPRSMSRGRRGWGYTIQLYGLRSRRNWGIGDFSDLSEFARIAAQQGATAIGLNPLHAMFPDNPLHASPYSPSHRQFLAIIYIDPETTPEFGECEEAQELLHSAAVQEELAELRRLEMVDYQRVAALKRPVLELLYRTFRERHLGAANEPPPSDRGAAFRRFQSLGGRELEKLALFQAISEHFGPGTQATHWPRDYRDPDSGKVREFAAAHAERVEFFQYLQWLADQQLSAAAQTAHREGSEIGLYHDLALAPDRNGAEAWGNSGLFAQGVTLGAPPDDWNLKGQNWGLPPYSPLALRQAGYRPFIDVIRANMRHAGALRLDHAMWLERMYWIPEGMGAHDGGYVRYPIDDLMGILALESHRQRCIVIAEDLGTVPEGFRERLRKAEMLSYRLLYFSQSEKGEFQPSDSYIASAAVAANTHDLATLAGFWNERDLQVRGELGLYPSDKAKEEAHRQRARERHALISRLKREGVLSETFPENVEEFSFELATAVYRFLARTPSRLLLVSLEDVFGEVEQANLPGTTSEHPNWKRKTHVELEQFAEDPRMIAIAAAINGERKRKTVRDKRSGPDE